MNLPFFYWLKHLLRIEPIKSIIQMELYNKYKELLDSANINTTLRLSHFFGQLKHESNLIPKSESLNYSVKALLSLFGRHRITVEQADAYGRKIGQSANQEMLANILYGGAWGLKNLGNKVFGDGWKYRGRGFIQTTGLANYTDLSKSSGIDYVNHPEWLSRERDAMIGAIHFWTKNKLNELADKDDAAKITQKINGGTFGLKERIEYTNDFKKIFANV